MKKDSRMRARRIQFFLSQNFHVAEQFWQDNQVLMCQLKKPSKDFAEILEGKYDLPEEA